MSKRMYCGDGGGGEAFMSLRSKALSGGVWTGISAASIAFLQLFQVVLLSRVLSLDDFGLYALVMVVMQIVWQLSEMGIGAAIVQRRVVSENALSSLYWFNVIVGFGSAAILACMSGPLASLMGDVRLKPLLQLSATTVAVAGVGQQYKYLLQKALDFQSLAYIDVSATCIGVGVSYFCAIKGMGASSFLVGMLANYFFRTIFLIVVGFKHHRPRLRLRVCELEGYLKFGMFLSAQGIVNILSSRIDSIIVGRVLGSANLGLYYLAQQFTSRIFVRTIPIVSRVAFPVLSQMQGEVKSLQSAYYRIVQIVAVVLLPVFCMVGLTSTEIVTLFLEGKWYGVIPLINIMVIVMAIKTIIAPVGILLMVKGRTDVGFYMNAYILIQQIACISVGVNFGIVGVAWAVLGSTLFSSIIWLLIQFKLAPLSLKELLGLLRFPVESVLVLCISVGFFRYLATWSNWSALALFSGALGIGLCSYALYCLSNKSMWKAIFNLQVGQE